MEAIVAYLKREPVVLLDAVKALLAIVVIFGLPVPPGLDVAIAGALVALLTIATRGMVSPVPDEVDEEVEEEAEEEVPSEDPIDEAPDAVPRDDTEE